MATVHLANVDDQGNFTSPAVNARLAEKFGGVGGGGISPSMTLDELEATEPQTTPTDGA